MDEMQSIDPATPAEEAPPSILADVEHVAQDAVAEVRSVFVDTEKVILSALGHVHNLLSSFSVTNEVALARTAVETAIINFAKHIGG